MCKGKQGKGEWSGAKVSGVRASGASEARASKARWRGEEQEKGDHQRFPLSSSSYDFFPRAIAPFTGIFFFKNSITIEKHNRNII